MGQQGVKLEKQRKGTGRGGGCFPHFSGPKKATALITDLSKSPLPLEVLTELSHSPRTPTRVILLPPPSCPSLSPKGFLAPRRSGGTGSVPSCLHRRGLDYGCPCLTTSLPFPAASGHIFLANHSPHPTLASPPAPPSPPPAPLCSLQLSLCQAGLSHFRHAFSFWSGQFGKSLRLPRPWP